MELTTNEVLGGVAAVIGVANLVAMVWLIRRLLKQVNHYQHRQPLGALNVIFGHEPVRIVAGFALKTMVIGVVVLLTIPVRALRQAGHYDHAGQWLESALWWEVPGMFVLLVALALIMWPAFTKWAPVRVSLTVAVLIVIAVFFFGAVSVGWAAQFI